MKIERLKIADLKPAEKNTRTHTAKQLEELIRSYRMFGQIRPVIIDENNVIWCGNGLFLALRQAGEAEVDALRVVGLTESQKKKLMLADNQIFTLGTTNTAVMDEFLSEIEDFDIPGYDSDMLEQLYGDLNEATEAMSSYGIIPEETVVQIQGREIEKAEVQEARVFTKDEAPVLKKDEDDSLPPTIQHTNGMFNVPKDKDTRPFIVCPKCGEKIWV